MTAIRRARCGCDAVRIECRGEPVRLSVCHCGNCKRRTGSAFATQVRFTDADVSVAGAVNDWSLTGDEGGRARFRFCTTCGVTVFYTLDTMPGLTAIPLGLFDDPHFGTPDYSVYEGRKLSWVEITGAEERYD